MDKFNYAVALVSFITGVGLSDLAMSLHRLLKNRSRVVWTWIPIALALNAGLALMRLWYQLWSVHDDPTVTGLPFVAVLMVQTLVLVLVVVAALPDESDFRDGRVDLGAYYAAQWRYVWTTYLVFLVMWIGTGVYFQLVQGTPVPLPFFALYFGIPSVVTIIALGAGRRWHGLLLMVLIAHEIILPANLVGLGGLIFEAMR